MDVCSSPKLFAAYHVFHRLPVPRHSPYALSCLTIAWNSSDTILFLLNCLRNLFLCFSISLTLFRMFGFQGAGVNLALSSNGGDYEIRTRDPLLARQVLSQLS